LDFDPPDKLIACIHEVSPCHSTEEKVMTAVPLAEGADPGISLIQLFNDRIRPRAILSSAVMSAYGVGGLFSFIAAVTGLFAFFALTRGLFVGRRRFKRRRPFLLIQAIFAHDLAHTAKDTRTGS
jgi:hypothetical protein